MASPISVLAENSEEEKESVKQSGEEASDNDD